jgi:hypothetical protein
MSGLTDYAEQTALETLLPNGTDVFVGFFTVEPTADDGTGGTEASGSGYARKAHQAWTNTTSGDITYRVNNGAIEFAALTADLVGINGWGIWDAVSGGNMIAFGPILDAGGAEVVDKTFTSGNQPRFINQELMVGLN